MWQHAKRSCQLLLQLVLVSTELLLRTMVWHMKRGTRSHSELKAAVVPLATWVVVLPALWLLRPAAALLGPATACHVPSADELVHRCHLQGCLCAGQPSSPAMFSPESFKHSCSRPSAESLPYLWTVTAPCWWFLTMALARMSTGTTDFPLKSKMV